MRKRKAAKQKQSNFVRRIKGLPEDAALIQQLDGGTSLFADTFGTVYAVRQETVSYRLLQGADQGKLL